LRNEEAEGTYLGRPPWRKAGSILGTATPT